MKLSNDDKSYLVIKVREVKIVKEVKRRDILPVAMFKKRMDTNRLSRVDD